MLYYTAERPSRTNGVIQLPAEWLNRAVAATNRMLGSTRQETEVWMPEVYGRPSTRLSIQVVRLESAQGRITRAQFNPRAMILYLNKIDDTLYTLPYARTLWQDENTGRTLTPQGRQVLAHELRHMIQAVLERREEEPGRRRKFKMTGRGGPRRKAKGSLPEDAHPAFLGAFTRPLAQPLFPEDRRPGPPEMGVVVENVFADTPAEQAGIREGDILETCEGVPLYKHADLFRIVSQHRPGDEVDLHVLRGSRTRAIRVKLKARPVDTWTSYVLGDIEYQAWLGDAVDESTRLIDEGLSTVRDEIAAFQESEIAAVWRMYAPLKYRDALSTLYNELTRRQA